MVLPRVVSSFSVHVHHWHHHAVVVVLCRLRLMLCNAGSPRNLQIHLPATLQKKGMWLLCSAVRDMVLKRSIVSVASSGVIHVSSVMCMHTEPGGVFVFALV